MTINISLPKKLLSDVKKEVEKGRYTSISEFMRDALRDMLYPKLTENGFTPEFEQEVLEAAKEPVDHSKVWRTEKDIHDYFENLRKELKLNKKNGKSKKGGKI